MGDDAVTAQKTTSTDIELPVDEVAARLGLPVGMLVRRIEAGDIPAREEHSSGEARYFLRLSDLGITAEEAARFQGNQHSARSRSGGGDDAVDSGDAGEGASAAVELTGHAIDDPDAAASRSIDDVVPPPGSDRPPELSIIDSPESPRAELATMTIDPRELVAGLLDRWERTLEQRIYAEQRQRFEGELTNRMHQVKELQMELQAMRAEHAAAQAEKDRVLAAKERELSDRERALAAERSKPRRRGWFPRL
jgi:hypothetical protein